MNYLQKEKLKSIELSQFYMYLSALVENLIISLA